MLEQIQKSSKQASPHEGHRERLRQRFLRSPKIVDDYELIELLLAYVFRRSDTKPLAKALVGEFGSIRAIIDAPLEIIQKISGLGPAVSTFFSILRELFARYTEAPLINRVAIASPEAVAQMAKIRLAGVTHEEVWVALVDNQNRLLKWHQLVKGSVSSSPIYPRDVFAIALEYKASGIILVHNHPGGSHKPSPLDEELTVRIHDIAQTLDIRFLDHIIITESSCYSIRQHTILKLN